MSALSARILVVIVASLWLGISSSAVRADDPVLFVSAFAGGEKSGIHAYRFDPQGGGLTELHRTTDVQHPFFLALSPDQRFLYSIHAETFGGKQPEQVAAYAIDGRTGRLKLLNRQSTHGSASCYLDVDATGKTVLVANYSTGNVASFPVREDGSLGEAASKVQHQGSSVDPNRQQGPYAHCFVVSPDNRFALAADLGLDQILIYRLEAATAKLTANTPPFAATPAGAGPRHLTFHPNGKHVYVINELQNSVTLFDYATDRGALTQRQTISTLPADFTGTSYCADVKITPNGKFLYGTNRGHDSLAMYSIGENGRLTLLGIEPSLGAGPQNLLITPDGRWLLCANMPGNNVALFRIDDAAGRLQPSGQPISLPSPSCLRLLK